MIRRFAAAGASILLAATVAWADGAKPSHGISVFGDLKYPPGFTHFDYVNADAPKGGEFKLQSVGPTGISAERKTSTLPSSASVT